MALSALFADIKSLAEFPDAAHRGAVQYKVGVLRGQTRPNLDTRLKEKKMSSLTNTIIIFPTSVLAGVAAYVLTKNLGDLLSIEQRPLFRLRFAAMAACTAFCFISYFMWTVGVPFDLAVFWPGGKTTYPWWVLPLTLGVSVLWYRTLSKNTTTFGER